MKKKSIECWMLMNKRTKELVVQAGVAFQRNNMKPASIYAGEFKEVKVKIEIL